MRVCVRVCIYVRTPEKKNSLLGDCVVLKRNNNEINICTGFQYFLSMCYMHHLFQFKKPHQYIETIIGKLFHAL